MPHEHRGNQDVAGNDKCPSCGMLYVADTMGQEHPGLPIPPETQVQCFFCDHTGPIKNWWDAFDNSTR